MPIAPVARHVLGAAVLVCSCDAFAQASESAEDVKKLEKIEVTGPNEVDERRQSTASKIVVNRDEILRYGDTTLLDVMKRLPGVSVSGSGGRGSDIRMRGLGGGYAQILVNGERMPPGFSIEELSPELIERIEILRSATAEFSTQAIAGTINIVLRRALASRQREVKAGGSVENGEPSTTFTAQVSDKDGGFSYTLPFVYNTFRFANRPVGEQLGLDAGGRPDLLYRTDESNRGRGSHVSSSPKLLWSFGNDNSLALDLFANVNRFRGHFDEASTTLLGAGPFYDATSDDYSTRFASGRANATWIRKLADDARMEVRLGFSYNRRRSETALQSFDDARGLVLDRSLSTAIGDSGLTTTGKYSAPLVTGHAFVFGWDGAQSQRTEDRVQRDDAPAGFPRFDIDEAFKARVLRAALFAQDEWELTPRLSAYLGLRWEGIGTKSEGNTFREVQNRSSVWSPIAQGLWKLPGTEKDQVRAAIARTYKAPNTSDLMPRRFIANNNTATTPDYQGNPDLKPELSWGLDVAYEHYFAGGGLASLSAFQRKVDNLIVRELVIIDGTYILRPGNLGSATVRGLELDTKFNLRRFWTEGPATDIRANLALNDSKVDAVPGPDNRLADQTRITANLGFDHRMTAPPLAFGGTFGYRSGGPIRTSLTQSAYSSPRRTLDLYALYRFNARVQLRMTANNLLAQDFERIDTYFDGTRTLRLSALNPGYRRVGAVVEVKL